MPLDFPNSPTNGQTYNAGGKTWEYNGGVWVLRGVVANLSVDGVTGLGTNVATFLATPTSANLAAAVTGETGSGSAVFSNSPTLTTPEISSISNSGTITIPTGTDTLVGRATTDTLTNKTLSSATLTGTLTAGGSTGTSGQVLQSTGGGVSWILLSESDQSILANQIFG